MPDVLVDTDVFIDHLRGHRPLVPGEDGVHYSVVTRAELFAGRSSDEEVVRTLLAPFIEIALDRSTAERAGRLRRLHAIGIAEALIAATALEHELALVTRNLADFAAVTGLRVQGPT